LTPSQQQTLKKLLSGWPRTTPIRDWQNNVTGFRITADYFTPERYKLANGLAALTSLVAAADMAYLAFQVYTVDFAVAAGIGVIMFSFICWKFWSWVFQKTTTIEMTRDMVKISRAFGYDRYNHLIPPQFTMEQHDDAWLEAKEMERNTGQSSRLYLDSFYVVMTMPGQKAEIATVFKKRKAEGLVLRLQLIQQLIDTASDHHAESGDPRGQRPHPA
jgi:hypothetical protein